jgi:hypothetical protein
VDDDDDGLKALCGSLERPLSMILMDERESEFCNSFSSLW